MAKNNLIKYTRDGKKVLVIEYRKSGMALVREIFVDKENKEYPAGDETLVNQSFLFDGPVVTWYENNEKKRKKESEDKIKEYERQEDGVRKRLRGRQAALEGMIKNADGLLKGIKPEALETLKNFLAGKITHIVKLDTWGNPAGMIKPLEDEILDTSDSFPKDIKLITLFGDSNGELDYRINNYRDGSGGNSTFIPCTSYEDALCKLQKYFDGMEKYGDYDIRAIKHYNLKFDKLKLKAYKLEAIKDLKKSLEKNRESFMNQKKRIVDALQEAKALNVKLTKVKKTNQ